MMTHFRIFLMICLLGSSSWMAACSNDESPRVEVKKGTDDDSSKDDDGKNEEETPEEETKEEPKAIAELTAEDFNIEIDVQEDPEKGHVFTYEIEPKATLPEGCKYILTIYPQGDPDHPGEAITLETTQGSFDLKLDDIAENFAIDVQVVSQDGSEASDFMKEIKVFPFHKEPENKTKLDVTTFNNENIQAKINTMMDRDKSDGVFKPILHFDHKTKDTLVHIKGIKIDVQIIEAQTEEVLFSKKDVTKPNLVIEVQQTDKPRNVSIQVQFKDAEGNQSEVITLPNPFIVPAAAKSTEEEIKPESEELEA